MHVFIAAWRLPPDRDAAVLDALSRLTVRFPGLDQASLWHERLDAGFYAGVQTARAKAAPRRYRSSAAGRLVLYAGCPLDAENGWRTSDAAVLSRHWSALPARLEGNFAIVRHTPGQLELFVDPLGLHQTFWTRAAGAVLVSNSAALLGALSPDRGLDHEGASSLLLVGFPWFDTTLRRGIAAVPGGAHWTWTGDAEPARRCAFGLEAAGSVSAAGAGLGTLGTQLCHLARSASSYGPLEASITAGRDSRLVLAVLEAAGLDVSYATGGDPRSADVRIGQRIARDLGLRHRVEEKRAGAVAERWQEAVARTVREGDGMVDLWHAHRSTQPCLPGENLPVVLWGVGGELARSPYFRPAFFLSRRSRADVHQTLAQAFGLDRGRGLFADEVHQTVRRGLDRFYDRCRAAGLPGEDVPDAFYVWQVLRRWAGGHGRLGAGVRDVSSLLTSRPFIRAAFRLPALHRHTEPLHRGLIRLLAPRLLDYPFEKEPWRAASPLLNLLQQTVARHLLPPRLRTFLRRVVRGIEPAPKAIDPAAVLRDQLAWLRELCLGQPRSEVWGLVHRARFEALSAPGAPLDGRSVEALFKVATLCAAGV